MSNLVYFFHSNFTSQFYSSFSINHNEALDICNIIKPHFYDCVECAEYHEDVLEQKDIYVSMSILIRKIILTEVLLSLLFNYREILKENKQ